MPKLARTLVAATLYVGIALGAISASQAGPIDVDALSALREGTMKKLRIHATPQDVSAKVFLDRDDAEHSLADHRGKTILLNLWATWCAPCRKEMPALSALQAELGGEAFAVVTVATGRNPLRAVEDFMAERGIDNLPLLFDPTQGFARDMGVLGLPVSVIIDANGLEVARMQGDAEWDSPSAVAIIRAVIASTASDG